MDMSASFQFLVDALADTRRIYAPDWRGFGSSAWSGADSYWFPDYLADLDALLMHLIGTAPALLVGHSMGGNVASLFAGIRPERVAKLVNLEGFGLAASQAEDAPGRYARWLTQLSDPPAFREYANFAQLAERLHAQNPRLPLSRAEFLAHHWGKEEGGRVVIRSDPAHKKVNPVGYRLDEAKACWRKIAAPVLWVTGAETSTPARLGITAEDLASRKACFHRLAEITLVDSGHMLHHDQPERLAAALESFL
jgi:pimeloyl-ACP methyl ester carboxylesterase